MKRANLSKVLSLLTSPYFLLFCILCIGLTFRLIHFRDQIFFGYDQAKDLQEVYLMVQNRNPKTLGPGTDIVGLFSGPLYYYLLLPVYAFSHYNPNAAAGLMVGINLLGILLLYQLGTHLSNRTAGLVAALLWAVSYEQANFARFISNASPLSITAIVFFVGLYFYFVVKKDAGLIISAIGLALGIQFDFYLVYLVICYPLFFWRCKRPHQPKTLLLSAIALALLSAWFPLAEIKFRFQGTRALLTYLSTSHGRFSLSFLGGSLWLYLTSLSSTFFNSFFAITDSVAIVLFLSLFVLVHTQLRDKQKLLFLDVWLFSTLILFAFRINVVTGVYIHTTIAGASTLFVALGIAYLLESPKTAVIGLVLILTVFLFNLRLFIRDSFISAKILGYQRILFADQKKVIDYTYQSAAGKPFSVCTLTNPLFVNTVWSVVYKVYGEPTYGQLPAWSGSAQTINQSFLSNDVSHLPTRYLILEPDTGFPALAAKATIYKEDQVSVINEVKRFGEIIVQMRTIPTDKSKLSDSQHLSSHERNLIAAADYRYSCYHTY